MTPKRIRVGGVAFPSDPRILKKASSRLNLIRGLKALDLLWKRGLLPWDLENHFLMTWLAYENGNVQRLSNTIGLHRNTLIFNFKEKIKKQSTFKLRTVWRKIQKKQAKRPFADHLFAFYHKVINRPRFTKTESEKLKNLWLMGIPRKVVLAHFISWSFRHGFNFEEVSKNLGTSGRSVHRYRIYATQKGSQALKWLGPMKAKKTDWFPTWKKWRMKNQPKSIGPG